MMTKRIFCGILSLILLFSLSACRSEVVQEESFDAFTNVIDTEYSEAVMTALSELGDDPDTGNRSSGSPAEREAAEYLFESMKEIGLSNVTKDEAKVDSWTYRGGNLTYQDASGQSAKIVLGGYATKIKAKNERLKLVYLNKGTEADYETVDVEGKLVLIDIDQDNDWWINYPAYQAKIKGARAVIAMSVMNGVDENRITSQDICGPADAPVLAISQKDSLTLRELIRAGGNGEITVTLNADSAIKKDSSTYNVWGEIPGRTDEVIYLFGHYDGYYHSSFDNASGIATCLGIAKALMDSNYVPEKTIRVVAHGAEEWGRIDSAFDWSAGAYEQIMTIHPEWAKDGFAIINIDGAYPVLGEMKFGISTSHELQAFTKKYTEELLQASGYDYSLSMPASTGTEDFPWTAAGIPSIVAGEGDESLYFDSFYHSNTDASSIAGFDADTFRFHHALFGQILLNLDALAVRPMDFSARFEALEESLDTALIKDPDLFKSVEKAVKAGDALTKKINKLNKNYAAAVAEMKKAEANEDENAINEASEKRKELSEEAAILNDALFSIYKQIQDDFLRIDWDLEVTFPHENYQENVLALNGAIAALESGNIISAYDDFLPTIDYAWYATAFDKETYDYFLTQVYERSEGTFGEGRIEYPAADLYAVVQSLGAKYERTNSSTVAEVSALQAELAKQNQYLTSTIENEKAALARATESIEELLE